MGTISEKLTYLNDTRLEIKDGLNKFGADLTENDTFRSYSNVINDIYDKLPKVSGNGSNFSLENAQNGKLDSFGMDGNTIQGRLPSGYTQVDYLASSGSQYIDTGVNADTKLRVILDMVYINPTGTNQTIGAINIGSPNKRYHLLSGTNTISIWVNDTSYNIIQSADTNRHLWDLNVPDGKVVLDNTTTTTIPTNIDDTELNFWLFGRNSNASQYKGAFKIWACKMYYNGTLVRDFIPCYRNSDNEIGLYDLVNNVFYTNQGTGTFTYGSIAPTPDSPIDIEVVENEQNINVHGKNLFDKDNANILNAYIQDNTRKIMSANNNKIIYIKCKPNTAYNIQKMVQANTQNNRFRIGSSNEEPVIGTILDNYINLSDGTTRTNYTYTTSSNANYLVAFIYYDTDISTFQEMLNSIQIEEGSTATTYEPYQSQDYEIDLGDIELCKIGDYKDKIYKENDKWYLHKEIGKYILTGASSESWFYNQYITGSEVYGYQMATTLPNIALANTGTLGYICDNFTCVNAPNYNANNEHLVQMNNKELLIAIKRTTASDLNAFKTWLSTHNTEVYYVLATPTYETITDETLISQLESIETFTGLNYFSVSNDNNVLPTLYVSRLKELGKLE